VRLTHPLPRAVLTRPAGAAGALKRKLLDAAEEFGVAPPAPLEAYAPRRVVYLGGVYA